MTDAGASKTHARRRGVRRWLVRAVVFLLLGAVVNVAVAWGCVFTAGLTLVSPVFDSFGSPVGRILGPYVDVSSSEWRWVEAFDADTGQVTRFGTAFEFHDTGYHFHTIAATDDAVWLGPNITMVKCGWPFDAMTGASLLRVDLDREYCWTLRTNRGTYPLQPIWPGFAINTILYAVILWLLFATPFALRRWRRMRRGLCAKCAYPVGESAVCTECGRVLRRQSA